MNAVVDIEHARLKRAAARGDGEAVELVTGTAAWVAGLRAKKRERQQSAWLAGFDAAQDRARRPWNRARRWLSERLHQLAEAVDA